jgi:spermidine synthase
MLPMTMRRFEEHVYPYAGQWLAVDTVRYSGRSRFQDVLFFHNSFLGEVLVLDGIIQVTERDEFVYSEMCAHVPLFAHPDPKRVLIIGGGDGCVLEEILKHPGVEKAVLVDIDEVVVGLCREHLRVCHHGAFDAPRAEVRIADGIAYAAQTDDRFDVVIVDGPDPMGAGDAGSPLYTSDFFSHCARILAPGGLFVTQNDVPFHHGPAMAKTTAGLRRSFRHVGAYVAPIPTFGGGHMAFVTASNDGPDPSVPRANAPAIAGLGYYTPEVHRAAFALPPYVVQAIEGTP